MNVSRLFAWVGIWVVSAGMPGVQAQNNTTPKVIADGKRATVFIDTPDSNGSGFCIHEAGVFVTNAHVVEGHAQVKVVLSPGEADQQVLLAKVTHYDAERDLALLVSAPPLAQQLPDIPALPLLPLGNSDALFETLPVAVFGFPFGANLALDEEEAPSVTVNLGRITSLRRLRGELKEIQLDAAINPGNSGGPVINEQGQVIGIVHAGVEGAQGLNFAIPANNLRQLMREPEILLDLPEVDWERRFGEQAFEIQVAPFTFFPGAVPGGNFELEFAVGSEGEWRNLNVARIDRHGGGTAIFHVVGAFFQRGAAELEESYRIILRQNGRVVAHREDGITVSGLPETLIPGLTLPPAERTPRPGQNAPVMNPANGHRYKLEYVPQALRQSEAKALAEGTSFAGVKGHLATITSEAELQFITEHVLKHFPTPGDAAWIGGTQKPGSPEPGGGWEWLTGEPMEFTRWAPGEPNNAGNLEFQTQIRRTGSWNDVGEANPTPFYVVEFDRPGAPIDGGTLPEIAPGPNNHWYKLVHTPEGMTWRQAKAAAEAMTHNGLKGHIASINDAVEQRFITRVLARMKSPGDTGWIGGFQKPGSPEPTGGWEWTTGEPMTYTSWNPGEPNNANNAELFTEIRRDGVWNDADDIATLSYYVVEFEPAGNLASNAPPAEITQGPNGHWYQLVVAGQRLSWRDAKAAAEAMTYKGLEGHLATITTAAEQEVITKRVTSRLRSDADVAWLGGSQKQGSIEPKGGWNWVTGEVFDYTNWEPGEPNDVNQTEYLMQIHRNGTWNDNDVNNHTRYYIVEFEP